MKTFDDLKAGDKLYCITFGTLQKFIISSINKENEAMYIYLKEFGGNFWIPCSAFNKSRLGSVMVDLKEILNYIQEDENY